MPENGVGCFPGNADSRNRGCPSHLDFFAPTRAKWLYYNIPLIPPDTIWCGRHGRSSHAGKRATPIPILQPPMGITPQERVHR
jgi:hypothetical protein